MVSPKLNHTEETRHPRLTFYNQKSATSPGQSAGPTARPSSHAATASRCSSTAPVLASGQPRRTYRRRRMVVRFCLVSRHPTPAMDPPAALPRHLVRLHLGSSARFPVCSARRQSATSSRPPLFPLAPSQIASPHCNLRSLGIRSPDFPPNARGSSRAQLCPGRCCIGLFHRCSLRRQAALVAPRLVTAPRFQGVPGRHSLYGWLRCASPLAPPLRRRSC